MTDREWPVTAEALMRSRFAAYRDGDVEWLRATWHRSTLPDGFDLDDNPAWRGLQIVDVVAGAAADETGVVEFRATYRTAQGVQVLHERSRFVREGGRWVYLDGEVQS